MPLKYPRYFIGSEEPFTRDIVCFPAEDSLGTAYYLELGCWASGGPNWNLNEMKTPPVDVEILRWQAIALGVPSELPPFKPARPEFEEVKE